MKNKKAIIGLGAIATLLFGVASSIAYLTDTDTTVNVMTVGNVKIAQLEYERAVDADGNWIPTDKVSYGFVEDKLQPYTQAKPIAPSVYKNEKKTMIWDDRVEGHQQGWSQVGAPGSNQLFDDSVKNVIDKFVFVENTGRKDAYYRTIIAIELPEGISEDLLHVNFNSNSRFDYNTEETGVQAADKSNKFYATINGNRYLVYTATYTEVLIPGEVSRPSLLQVYLDPKTTNEDVELFGETFEILAVSQAVQTDGFDSATEALEEAFGEVNESSTKNWFGNLFVQVNSDEETEKISNALSSGKDVIAGNKIDMIVVEAEDSKYDAKGATVIMNGEGAGNYGYLAFAQDKTEEAEIKNVNVTGTGFVEFGDYGVKGGKYYAENITVKNMRTTLAVTNLSDKVTAAFAHYGTATLNNCVMTGTVSGVDGYTAYDAGFVNGTKTFINGGEYGSMYIWNQAHVTINDAKVGTIVSAAITYKSLGKLTIAAGTTVDTIKLVPGSYTPAIVIEDGATVGKIIYNGVTYTQTEWLSR